MSQVPSLPTVFSPFCLSCILYQDCSSTSVTHSCLISRSYFSSNRTMVQVPWRTKCGYMHFVVSFSLVKKKLEEVEKKKTTLGWAPWSLTKGSMCRRAKKSGISCFISLLQNFRCVVCSWNTMPPYCSTPTIPNTLFALFCSRMFDKGREERPSLCIRKWEKVRESERKREKVRERERTEHPYRLSQSLTIKNTQFTLLFLPPRRTSQRVSTWGLITMTRPNLPFYGYVHRVYILLYVSGSRTSFCS